jgi:hypothetical protein
MRDRMMYQVHQLMIEKKIIHMMKDLNYLQPNYEIHLDRY